MPNLTVYQIAVLILALFFIVDRSIKYVKKETGQSLFKYISTVVVWMMLSALIVFPVFSSLMSDKTLVYIGFITVFIIVFKLLGIIEKLERNITEIVRKEALRDLKK